MTHSLATLLGVAALLVADDRLVRAAAPPAIPATPAAADALLYARRFTLRQTYRTDWRKERPTVKTGLLIVLRVNPDLVYPRQTEEPVLYVGDHTAERINLGYRSGVVVALVPADVDLRKSPIWFGTPRLPERVDKTIIAAERAAAEKAGVKPFSAKQIEAAAKLGGKAITAADKTDLLRHAADLIRTYSPDETELADTLAPAEDRR